VQGPLNPNIPFHVDDSFAAAAAATLLPVHLVENTQPTTTSLTVPALSSLQTVVIPFTNYPLHSISHSLVFPPGVCHSFPTGFSQAFTLESLTTQALVWSWPLISASQ
jgi:hypothetical protein